MVSVARYPVDSYTEQLAKHSGLVAELMAEFKWKQRGISRTSNEVPVISSCVYNKVCPKLSLLTFTSFSSVVSQSC
jgi:hypothetical protein